MRSDAGKEFNVNLDRWNHWDLAYAQTVHSSQGRTSEKVIAHMESDRANLVNQRALYVAISRAKDQAIIVTDNAEKLKTAVYNRSGENSIAGHESGKGVGWDWGFDGHEDKSPPSAKESERISQEDLDLLLGRKSSKPDSKEEIGKDKDDERGAKVGVPSTMSR
jgi:ATP-dependent exoDNAse (exonuclease V) beta subunit